MKLARAANPSISIKLNTVVNAINADEDIASAVSLIAPERWKVLRVLPVLSPALSITDEQFRGFVGRHAPLSSVMSVEDNQDMVRSYVMVDPLGRFFQNASGQIAYSYSRPIQEGGSEILCKAAIGGGSTGWRLWPSSTHWPSGRFRIRAAI